MDTRLQAAYEYCEQMAKSHYENFPVGSLLIPKAKRPHVWCIYAFARSADDFADENYPSRKGFPDEETWRQEIISQENERLEKLKQWEQWLQECSRGKAEHPIFIALENTLQELRLPVQLLSDLLTAFKMDVTKRRYTNWEEVLFYCQHSANPVGRLVLRIFGYKEQKLDEMSDAICTGLQLANFWQDIAVDLEKDRIYIPQELLQKNTISLNTLFNPSFHGIEADIQNKLQNLLQELGAFTLPLFQKGRPLPLEVKGRLSWELKCTWLGGMNILKRACFNKERQGLNRPHISSGDKLKILWQSFFAYPKRD